MGGAKALTNFKLYNFTIFMHVYEIESISHAGPNTRPDSNLLTISLFFFLELLLNCAQIAHKSACIYSIRPWY